MKQVIMFEAGDGHKFDTAAECVAYEAEAGVTSLVTEYFSCLDVINEQDVADFVNDNWIALCNVKLNHIPVVGKAPSNDAIARHHAADWADKHTPVNASITVWHVNFERAHRQRLNDLTQSVDTAE